MDLLSTYVKSDSFASQNPCSLAEYMHYCSFQIPFPAFIDYHPELFGPVYKWVANVTFKSTSQTYTMECTYTYLCPDSTSGQSLLYKADVSQDLYNSYNGHQHAGKPVRMTIKCQPQPKADRSGIDYIIVSPDQLEDSQMTFPEFAAYFYGITPTIQDKVFNDNFSHKCVTFLGRFHPGQGQLPLNFTLPAFKREKICFAKKVTPVPDATGSDLTDIRHGSPVVLRPEYASSDLFTVVIGSRMDKAKQEVCRNAGADKVYHMICTMYR